MSNNNNNARANKITRIGKYHNNHQRSVHVFNKLPTLVYSVYGLNGLISGCRARVNKHSMHNGWSVEWKIFFHCTYSCSISKQVGEL